MRIIYIIQNLHYLDENALSAWTYRAYYEQTFEDNALHMRTMETSQKAIIKANNDGNRDHAKKARRKSQARTQNEFHMLSTADLADKQ